MNRISSTWCQLTHDQRLVIKVSSSVAITTIALAAIFLISIQAGAFAPIYRIGTLSSSALIELAAIGLITDIAWFVWQCMQPPPPRKRLDIKEGAMTFYVTSYKEVQLPPEVTSHIFSYLNTRDLVRCSEVARSWLIPARRAFCLEPV